MDIRVLALSDSDKHFSSAIEEYHKRIGKRLELINIKPIKAGTKEQIITKETSLLKERVQTEKAKGRYTILLSKTGKQYSTEQFTALLQNTTPLTFVIGGPYGLKESVLAPSIDLHISLGAHTMPHGLAKLVLLEQLYRGSMILSGKPYHY